MIKPLIWMFKAENFKEHALYLLYRTLIFMALSIILVILSNVSSGLFTPVLLYIAAGICASIPALMISGYYWELTENVIGRKVDITASDIYAKHSIKEIEYIEFPELSLKKFVWRGIASIVATLMLLYPIVFLIILSIATAGSSYSMLDFDNPQLLMMYGAVYCFIGLFIPALLWNYANRNSLFAVWNIFKAIHIIGTYPFRYLYKVFLFLLYFAIFGFVNFCISLIFGFVPNNLLNTSSYIATILYIGVSFVLNIYGVFVFAYILGTIAPPAERG